MAKRRPAGDGMVRKREDGRWEGRIVVGHKSNGDSIFRYISAPTQKELSAKLRQLTEAYKGVDLTEESNMSLSVWLDKWLDEYMAATLRPTTLNGYRRSLELHVKPYLGNKTLSKITAIDLRSLYRSLQETGRVHPRDGQSPGLSARTVHGIHTTLHHALKTAMEQNLIPSNPAAEVDPPKFDGAPMKILTEAQLDAFMRVIEKDAFWHDFFYTAVTTGLRRGEICALRWEDCDTKQETLHVRRTLHKEKGKPLTTGDTKTYAGTRKIVLPPSTAQLLRERKKTAATEWIFPNPFDPEHPIAPGTAYNRLKVLLKEAGLPDIRFHDLRHPYVKHTTKIFSLRLMDFQAQAYPDARRKTRGACQLLRVGQSRSPVRPLCNRKRFSCLPPQSKMSWILYAISMRLSGYTSTRSISSSASSVVSVSASKIALDASFRLSCRACSSCFCFACANTAA